jgi:hypothetical protein
MISLVDTRGAGAQQRRLPLWHKRLAEIIDLAKNLDDPASSPPSLSDRRLPQKAFHLQPVNRAKTPYPGCHRNFPPRERWGSRIVNFGRVDWAGAAAILLKSGQRMLLF